MGIIFFINFTLLRHKIGIGLNLDLSVLLETIVNKSIHICLRQNTYMLTNELHFNTRGFRVKSMIPYWSTFEFRLIYICT